MTDVTILPEAGCVRVSFADGTAGDFPHVWLRDNCPGAYHPDTRERTDRKSVV